MPARGHSTLSAPQSGRWHPAVSLVVEDVRALAHKNTNRFHLSQQRTGLLQDWAVGFGWEGARSVQGWMITDRKLVADINRDAGTMQRKCRRLVDAHNLKEQLGGERGAAAELQQRTRQSELP